MKLQLITVLAFAAVIPALNIDPRTNIDWDKVVPVQDLPGFWDDKDVKNIPISYDKPGRVVGGDFADPGQFPFLAALLLNINGNSGFCGGCVISNTVILTAAHCLVNANSAFVILGAYNYTQVEEGQILMFVPGQYFRVHENYEPRMVEQDVATIICPSFIFTPLIQPIPLFEDMQNQLTGEIAILSGFGRYTDDHHRTSDVVRFAALRVITLAECEQTFGAMIPSQLCTLGVERNASSCNGDSGGPLVVFKNGQYELAGTVSFGARAGCQKGHPSAYSRISHFVSWISDNMVL